jgi:hypothetical protein
MYRIGGTKIPIVTSLRVEPKGAVSESDVLELPLFKTGQPFLQKNEKNLPPIKAN